MSKKLVLVIVMLVFVTNYAFYQWGASRAFQDQLTATPTPSPTRSKPIYGKNQVLTYSQTSLALDGVSASEMHEHSLSVTNTTSEVVEVDEIKASCGCTLASLDKMTLQPDEEATLVVMLNPALSGDFFTISISVSYKGRPEIDTLQLSGHLVHD